MTAPVFRWTGPVRDWAERLVFCLRKHGDPSDTVTLYIDGDRCYWIIYTSQNGGCGNMDRPVFAETARAAALAHARKLGVVPGDAVVEVTT